MFLPTTLDSAERIVETIQMIKERIPDNPLEADLIMMAEMVAEDSEKDNAVSQGGTSTKTVVALLILLPGFEFLGPKTQTLML